MVVIRCKCFRFLFLHLIFFKALGSFRIPNGMKISDCFINMEIIKKVQFSPMPEQDEENIDIHVEVKQPELEPDVEIVETIPKEKEEEGVEEFVKLDVVKLDKESLENKKKKTTQNQTSRLFRFEKFYTNLKVCEDVEKTKAVNEWIQQNLANCEDWVPK
jgi:hypothetical protein